MFGSILGLSSFADPRLDRLISFGEIRMVHFRFFFVKCWEVRFESLKLGLEMNQNAVINTLNSSTPSSNNQFDTHVHVKNNKFYNEPRLIEYKRFELKPKELGIDASF